MTLVIAHRGASRAEPENTIAAFERAVAMGADAVELDVRRTADDRLVVHHDATLTDGTPISTRRAADLPAHVPTLERALDASRGVLVNIEIKNSPGEPDHDPSDWVAYALSTVLARRGDDRAALVSSFRPETVATARRLGLRTALLVEAVDADTVGRAAAAGHVAIHPAVGALDQATLRVAHAAGLAVNVWTCDDPARMAELIAWGVDGICTNVPDVALAIRRRVAGSA